MNGESAHDRTARDTEERVRQLEAIVAASNLVNSTLDLRTLAEHIVRIATELIGAERGSLFLVDHASRTLHSMVAQGLSHQALSLNIGEGIVGAVAENGKAEILDAPYADARFDPSVDRSTGFRTRSLLTVPVRDREGTLVAVLQLLNHVDEGFSEGDVSFLAEIGVPFAIALTTARLHREIVARERIKEELRLAAEIQQTLRPRSRDSLPGLELRTLIKPCLEVGGDYYDLIPCGDGTRWWLVMADISGKGVSAGLIASNVQAYMWSRRKDDRSLETTVAEGNELLYGLTEGRKFATMVVAQWDRARRLLRWVSAGHPPILVARRGAVLELEATGRPIGLLPDQSYSSGEITLEPGDLALLYTDGVIEAGIASSCGEFGLERLRQCLHVATTARDAVEGIAAAVDAHLGHRSPDDDITLLCARCTAGDEPEH